LGDHPDGEEVCLGCLGCADGGSGQQPMVMRHHLRISLPVPQSNEYPSTHIHHHQRRLVVRSRVIRHHPVPTPRPSHDHYYYYNISSMQPYSMTSPRIPTVRIPIHLLQCPSHTYQTPTDQQSRQSQFHPTNIPPFLSRRGR
jgi:hypothetical protein